MAPHFTALREATSTTVYCWDLQKDLRRGASERLIGVPCFLLSFLNTACFFQDPLSSDTVPIPEDNMEITSIARLVSTQRLSPLWSFLEVQRAFYLPSSTLLSKTVLSLTHRSPWLR